MSHSHTEDSRRFVRRWFAVMLAVLAAVALAGCSSLEVAQRRSRVRHGSCAAACERHMGGSAVGLCGIDGACVCMGAAPPHEIFPLREPGLCPRRMLLARR